MRARLGFLPVIAMLVGLIAPAPTLAIGTLDQSQTNVTGHCTWFEGNPSGQIFTAGQSGYLDTLTLFPWDDWSPKGIAIEIRTVAFGGPTSTVLASQAWSSTANGIFVDLTFSNPALVTAGTEYAIVATPTTGSISAGCSTVNDYPAGLEIYYISGTGWDGSSVVDWAFRTYVTPSYAPPLQMGYWKKNAAATTAQLPQTLGDYGVTAFTQAKAVFDASNCGKPRGDAVSCLAGQTLPAKLNVGAGGDPCIAATIGDADAFLTSVGYAGPGLYSLTKEQRAEAIALKTILTNYLLNVGCPA